MEVKHLEWLANPVLVVKKNKKWRMCIDYTSLNKACPKDPFALPHIDQVIDSTAGCDLLSFLDAYSGTSGCSSLTLRFNYFISSLQTMVSATFVLSVAQVMDRL